MSERTALPIGSVVRVREGVEPVMIVNHCPVTEKDGKQGYFDFGAVSLPLGLILSRYDEEVSKISYDHFTIEDFKK